MDKFDFYKKLTPKALTLIALPAVFRTSKLVNYFRILIIGQPLSPKFLENLVEIFETKELGLFHDDVILNIAVGTAIVFERQIIALANQYPHANKGKFKLQ